MATEWKGKIELAHLMHNEAFFSLWSSILCKLAYPLMVTIFNGQQCTEIMHPILQVGLPKIGCVQTMPRAVVHAPTDLAGLNIPYLYTEQLVTQIMLLLRYGPQQDEMMGVLIWALAEAMKLEMGLAGKVLLTPVIFEGLVTDMWMKQFWLDLLKYRLAIETDLLDFKPHQLNDIELMRLFAQNRYFGGMTF